MIERIIQDTERCPSAFYWYQPLTRTQVEAYLTRHSITVPDDLKELWVRYGGGMFFESVYILEPRDGDDDMLDWTKSEIWNRGLPHKYVLVAFGSCPLVLDLERQVYICADPVTQTFGAEYGSLDDWYLAQPANELGGQYGIPGAPREKVLREERREQTDDDGKKYSHIVRFFGREDSGTDE